MVVPHSGGYPHAKFEGNLLLFKFEPHTKSGLTIPQCDRGLYDAVLQADIRAAVSALLPPTALKDIKPLGSELQKTTGCYPYYF